MPQGRKGYYYMGRPSKKWTGNLGKPIIYNSIRKSDDVEQQMRDRIDELCNLLKIDRTSPNLTTDLLLALLQKEVPGFRFKNIEESTYENSEEAIMFYADIAKILLANPGMSQMDAFEKYNAKEGVYERDIESLNTIYHDIRKKNHYISEMIKIFDTSIDEFGQFPEPYKKELKEECINRHMVEYADIIQKLKTCKTEAERQEKLRNWDKTVYKLLYDK